MAEQRFEDTWLHQRNQPTEQRLAAGGHWGAQPGKGHKTATGATLGAFSTALSSGPDPNFSGHHTVDPRLTEGPVPHTTQNGIHGVGDGPQVMSTSQELEVQCGPLLNYRRMSSVESGSPIWHGTVLVVTNPGQRQPELRLRCLGPSSDGTRDNGLNALVDGETNVSYDGYSSGHRSRTFQGVKLYEDPGKGFWRFEIDLPFQDFEAKWEYEIPGMRQLSATGGIQGPSRVFNVPSTSQSMRILFHSCNGFSVGTDVDAWNGPALWNDVLRMHHRQPFHVMIGGGDQIYNDGVRVDGPLQQWTNIGNPKRRREFPFNEELRAKCDQYYFDNYIRWYNTEPFRTANGQIPQLNIWDDHDIIDGFGSYTDRFMQCAVFRGVGGVAHKYVDFHAPVHPLIVPKIPESGVEGVQT